MLAAQSTHLDVLLNGGVIQDGLRQAVHQHLPPRRVRRQPLRLRRDFRMSHSDIRHASLPLAAAVHQLLLRQWAALPRPRQRRTADGIVLVPTVPVSLGNTSRQQAAAQARLHARSARSCKPWRLKGQ